MYSDAEMRERAWVYLEIQKFKGFKTFKRQGYGFVTLRDDDQCWENMYDSYFLDAFPRMRIGESMEISKAIELFEKHIGMNK